MPETIIVIDDDVSSCALYELILSRAGHTIVLAYGGRAGIELIKEHQPALILCDVMMPDANGYKVLAAVKQNQQLINIPFIFLSARDTPGDRAQGLEAGADAYLTKPINPETLVKVVKQQLVRHAEIEEAKRKRQRNRNHEKDA